jgi:micrococcal nuclease
MSRTAVLVTIAAMALAVAACSGEGGSDAGAAGESVVERVADGDTLVLEGGDRVRLVQIDATELGEGECYAEEAMAALEELVPPGATVRLEADPRLDDVDDFGRLLRYVHSDGRNVNLELVREGAAAPYFFHGERGRYATELEAAGRAAREAGRGLWGACRLEWNPERPATAEPR